MSFIVSLFFSAIKALGIIDDIENMIALHKAQQQGMKDQAAADTAASLQGAKDANAIRDKVAQEGDSSVDADLSQFVRKPPTHG